MGTVSVCSGANAVTDVGKGLIKSVINCVLSSRPDDQAQGLEKGGGGLG